MQRSFIRSANTSFLATKSVSQFTSIRTPILPLVCMYEPTLPSGVPREPFLMALANPFFLRISPAFSKSPFASSSAILQSRKPALVRSLNSLTLDASIVIGILLHIYFLNFIDNKDLVLRSDINCYKMLFREDKIKTFKHFLVLARPCSLLLFLLKVVPLILHLLFYLRRVLLP